MNQQNHISEFDLRCSIDEEPTSRPTHEIESHIATCVECQERLMTLAAEPQWREKLVVSLSGSDAMGTEQLNVGREGGIRRSEATHDFDIRTAENYLRDHLAAPVHPEMLGRLDRYDVEKVVGCGGMGVVLRAFDTELHRPVAIKMILPRWSTNGNAKQRFGREARAAAAVIHPNVIAIHGIDSIHGVPYFVMPFVTGPSLQALVEQQGPLAEKEIVRIALQVTSGLAAAHSQGLVHRDIKPANILLDNQINRVLITDFGLARCDDDRSMTKTGWLAGTLNFMSPEQSRGEEVDPRSDLFSLGGLIYFLATGRLPFHADSPMGVLHKIGNESPKHVQALNEDISPTLTHVIERLLEKDAANRFQSAAELEAFLNEYLTYLHRPAHTHPPVVPRFGPQPGSPRLRVRLVAGLAAVAVIGVVAVLAAAMWGRGGNNRTPDGANAQPLPTWSSIEKDFGLIKQKEFDERITRLNHSVESLVAESLATETGESPLFEERFQSLVQDVESLGKSMNAWSSESADLTK